MTLRLATLREGQVQVGLDASRTLMRSSGLKFQEIDIESGSPREFHRKFARVVADAGYQIPVDTINTRTGAIGSGVGDVAGTIVAHRDEDLPNALRFLDRPYTVAGIVLGLVLLIMALMALFCGFMSLAPDDSGTTFVLLLGVCGACSIVGVLSFGLAFFRRRRFADVVASTILRVRTEGEAYETRTEMEVVAGRQVHRARITARLSVALSIEVVVAFDQRKVPAGHSGLLQSDATRYLTSDAARRTEVARQRAVAELDEFADRISKFSEVV